MGDQKSGACAPTDLAVFAVLSIALGLVVAMAIGGPSW